MQASSEAERRPLHRGWGAVLAAGTVVLSVPAAMLLHQGMPAAGFACLLAMAGCLAGALMLLDPLRK